jgi:hypothetical protein
MQNGKFIFAKATCILTMAIRRKLSFMQSVLVRRINNDRRAKQIK